MTIRATREGDQWRVILGKEIILLDASEAETQAEAVQVAKSRQADYDPKNV